MAGQSNPWAETDLLSGIKLGCPENGLVMARQFSLQRSVLPRSGSSVSNYPMSRYLEAVRKASDLQSALSEVEIQIFRCQLALQNASLMSKEALTEQLRVAGELLSHFSLLLEKKDLLRKRLQQVPSQGSLTMEAPYHKYCCKVLQSIPPVVNRLSEHLDTIDWCKGYSLEQSSVATRLSAVTESLSASESAVRKSAQVYSQLKQAAGTP